MTDAADNSFSPPEIQTVPGAGAGDLVVDVVPQAAPQRRSKWLIGGAVAAVAAVGVGVFALVGGSDKAHAGYSLTAASASAETAQNVAYELTMSIGDSGAVTATGRFDIEHQLVAMDMSMPQAGDKPISFVVDLGKTTMYMDASAFGDAGTMLTKWVSVDFGKVPAMKEMLGQASSTNNPLDVAKVFANAKSVEDLGTEDFRGEQVKHYKVTVVTADALAAYPALKEQVDKLGKDFPAEMVYDVYVTADSQLRRIVYEIEASGKTTKADVVYTAIGTVEPIVIPSTDEVTDISGMLPQA